MLISAAFVNHVELLGTLFPHSHRCFASLPYRVIRCPGRVCTRYERVHPCQPVIYTEVFV
jgi:hypothetical protein